MKRTASTRALTMCFQFQSKLSYSNQRLLDETEYDIKNYTDRGKAATLTQLLVIKYLNRVDMLRAVSRSQDGPAGPWPNQSF